MAYVPTMKIIFLLFAFHDYWRINGEKDDIFLQIKVPKVNWARVYVSINKLERAERAEKMI